MSDRQKAIERFLEASKLMKQGSYQDALDIYNEVRDELDTVPALYYNIAQIYAEQKAWEQAKQEIRQSLKLDPNNTKYLNFSFRIHQKLANYDKAIEIGKILRKLQYDPDTEINLAFLYLRTDDVEKAVDVFEDLLDNSSHDPIVYFTLGVLKYQNEDYAEAEKLLQEAIKQDFQVDEAHQVLVTILEENDRLDEAIKILEGIEDRSETLTYQLAKLYKQNERFGKALMLSEYLDKESDNLDYKIFRGHVMREMGNHEDAIEMYDKVLDMDGNNLSAIKGKALSLNELGQYDEANQLFEKGERINRGGEMPKFESMIQDLDVIG